MSVYVTEDGFRRETLQEIKKRLQDGFRAIFGPGTDVSDEGPNGQQIALFAQEISLGWEGSQEVYSSHSPSQATGTALDIVAALTGVSRIQASPGTASCLLYAEEAGSGTTVPAGKQARRTRGGVLYSLLSSVTLSEASCRDIYLYARTAFTASQSVTLITSFGTYTVTAPASGDIDLGTYELLADAINADTAWDGTAEAYDPPPAPLSALVTNEPCLRLLDVDQDFSATINTVWAFHLVGSAGNFQCDLDGPETAAIGEIAEIATPVAGWVNVYNQVVAQPGRNTETDSELRIRRAQSLQAGNATEDAIELALLDDVDGIIAASVFSNRTMETVDDRPPKSFEAVVQGGLNEDIGQVIWDTQPAGIESHGNVTVDTVLDINGFLQEVKFSRPVEKYLHVRVRYYVYDEETFPVDGDQRIKDAILAWSLIEYDLGTDVIPQRILTPVYTVPGIGQVDISVDLTDAPGDTPTYTTSVIPVGAREIAVSATDRMDVARYP